MLKVVEIYLNLRKSLRNAYDYVTNSIDGASSKKFFISLSLVEEVKSLGEHTSAILAKLKRAEESQAELVKARGTLEHEIMVKRKTLYIDKERGQLLRSFYPSTTDLSGF